VCSAATAKCPVRQGSWPPLRPERVPASCWKGGPAHPRGPGRAGLAPSPHHRRPAVSGLARDRPAAAREAPAAPLRPPPPRPPGRARGGRHAVGSADRGPPRPSGSAARPVLRRTGRRSAEACCSTSSAGRGRGLTPTSRSPPSRAVRRRPGDVRPASRRSGPLRLDRRDSLTRRPRPSPRCTTPGFIGSAVSLGCQRPGR